MLVVSARPTFYKGYEGRRASKQLRDVEDRLHDKVAAVELYLALSCIPEVSIQDQFCRISGG